MIDSFLKIWNFSKKRQTTLAKALIFAFLKAVFGMTQMVAIVYAIQAIIGNKTVKESLTVVIIAAVVCVSGMFFTSYVNQIATMEAGFFMVGDKRVHIGNMLRKIPLGFFNDTSSGQVSAVLTTTLSEVEAGAPTALISIVGGFLEAIVLLIAVFFYDWRVGVVTAVGMAVYFLVVNWQIIISERDAPKLRNAQNKLVSSTLSFLQGIKVTKSFSFRRGDEELKEKIQSSCDENISLMERAMPTQFLAHLCIAVFESIILILAVIMYFKFEIISLDKAIVIIVMSYMLYASINQAGSILSMIGILDSALSDIDELEKTELLECEEPKENIKSNEIIFENVFFSYGENEVLHDISTTIKPQSLTAIIGPSGSGKTTLCQLVPRFWDVSSGAVRIGGADIRHLDSEVLMSKISMVFQKVYLFEDTILNNIRFGKPSATLEEVRKAAKAARCDDFIMSLPDGYNTVIREGGSSLSGGEKQRISIARAILKDSPIIIMDEATSALDYENEQAILEAIDELTRNKTVIMIAHRMKSVRMADHIIAIENGRIVEEGTHEQLISKNGLYKRFLSEREQAVEWKVR